MADRRGLTAKQDKFCRVLVEKGCTAADAYRSAYDCKASKPQTVQQRACELLRDSRIAARVDTLRAKAAERCVVTASGHLEKLAQLRDQAAEQGAFAPAVNAEVARGKVAGLYTEKHEHKVDGGVQFYLPKNGRDGR